MDVRQSNMSCGVCELFDVGDTPTLKHYEDAMSDFADELGCFLIASVPTHWKRSIKFLKNELGFKQVGRLGRNPNTGNKIILLTKTITGKERAYFRRRSGGYADIY